MSFHIALSMRGKRKCKTTTSSILMCNLWRTSKGRGTRGPLNEANTNSLMAWLIKCRLVSGRFKKSRMSSMTYPCLGSLGVKGNLLIQTSMKVVKLLLGVETAITVTSHSSSKRFKDKLNCLRLLELPHSKIFKVLRSDKTMKRVKKRQFWALNALRTTISSISITLKMIWLEKRSTTRRDSREKC